MRNVLIAALLAGGVIAYGCGGSESGISDAKLPEGVRSQAVEHEECDESGHKVQVLDTNSDKKPDIKRVFDGAREVCRIADLNHDGKPDMFEYYDASGQLRRREADYDDNGVVNAIQTFQGGKLLTSQLDTTNQGKIDTWDTFDPATGARIKRERDATGDGRVDQWWTYEGDKVTIAMDRDGDGHPDPQATIVLGEDGRPVSMVASNQDAGALPPAPPAPPAAPAAPAGEPGSPLVISDAGIPGKPQRGAAKR